MVAIGTPLTGVVAAGALLLSPVPIGTGQHAAAGELVEPLVTRVASINEARVEPAADTDIEPLSRPLVVLYGDSLAWSARDAFTFAFADRPEVEVVVRTWGGTAICDWLDHMADDAAVLQPGAVVIQFSGNNLTPCMRDTSGGALVGDAYFDRYEADARSAIDTFDRSRTQVVLAGAPLAKNAQGDFRGGLLNVIYDQLARGHDGVRYADAGASVLDEGRWTATLPCLQAEPCTGGIDDEGRAVNIVRAPDGGHFCPASPEAREGVTGACPEWSSGAFRFGMALAGPVIEILDAT